MSPRDRKVVLLFALGIVSLALYLLPSFLYIVVTLALCGGACLLCRGPPLPASLGLNPRAGLRAQAGYLRRFWDWWVSDVPVVSRRTNKHDVVRRELHRPSPGAFNQRPADAAVYRGGHVARDTILFSPRDFLMGSYIAKAESPPGDFGRPRVVRNPRDHLREKLSSRPNHAVYTPNRRLSFAGEPSDTPGHFNITPQRHYPLQQMGTSPVGLVPVASWDGFRKKSILTPRNSPAVRSPVTMKIARPDQNNPSLERLSCAAAPRTPEDPCSRESVLKVLKDSRKREVEDADGIFIAEHRSKRRRNDSGGSAHSAFEPLLPNGAPSQLVPKPGTLKRGIVSVAEEYTVKRSRTSSVSSASGVHSPGGTLGSKRNPIQSSYSSTLGLLQFKKPSAPSSPMSSPASSRSQTPDTAAKRQREDDYFSPSSASSVRSERTPSDKVALTSKQTPVPVTTSSNSAGGSGGNRKRKIQLVCSNRDDQITLPPPPELGYNITVKDLDEEKKAAINKIQKVLETPLLEPEKSTAPVSSTTLTLTTILAPKTTTATSPTLTLSSLLAAPLPKTSSPATLVINLDPSPTPAISNPLLEALKTKGPVNTTSVASTTIVSAPAVSVPPPVLTPGAQTTTDSPKPPPVSEAPPPSSSMGQPSAFTQVLGQISKPANSTPSLPAPSPFGMSGQIGLPVVSSASNPAPITSASLSLAKPLLPSGFKPIFAVSTTASTPSAVTSVESKPLVQNFQPIFGSSFAPPPSTSSTTSTVISSITGAAFPPPPYTSSTTAPISSSIFSTTTSSNTGVSLFPGLTTPTVAASTASAPSVTNPAAVPAPKSMFGSWSAPSSASASATSSAAPTMGFPFGPIATTTAAAPTPVAAPASGAFTFATAQPTAQIVGQNVFSFGQTAVSQNTTTASFGGFATAAATTTNASATTTTQSSFAFGKPSFQTPAPQATFSSTTAAAKPFTFGASVATAAPTSNPAPAPFNFGGSAAAAPGAATAPSSFMTPTKPAFGGGSTPFAFGGSATPSTAPGFGQAAQTQSAAPGFGQAAQTQSAAPGFGQAAQTQSAAPSFAFGGAAPQQTPSGPAPAASSGFNFGAAVTQPQFGMPVANTPAPQMGSFNFAAAATSTPTFSPAASSLSPFGSQGFNAVPYGSPPTPSFSIGAGPKPTGARQRLQARRQHNRKK